MNFKILICTCMLLCLAPLLTLTPTLRADDDTESDDPAVVTETPYSDEGASEEEASTAAEDKDNPEGWNDGDLVSSLSYADQNDYTINTLIMFLCAVLVLFMQAGFAMVEVGLNAAKNTINILFKNVMDLSVGVLLFLLVGYSLMYPGGTIIDGVLGMPSPFLSRDSQVDDKGTDDTSDDVWASAPAYDDGAYASNGADFLFQVAFAATAATIVSGAVAGRMQFKSYLIYSALLTGIIYPISGYWKWGGGWLMQFGEQAADGSYPMGFQDFAGSAVVHAVGGFAGLAGAMILGPRLGRYSSNGKSVPMPGHNIAFAALGVFILWVGWYGFNPGSQLTYSGAMNAEVTANIAVNTTVAAGAGAVAAMFLAWILFGKPDVTMALNGALGGLVGITACCDCFTDYWSMVIGGVAGLIVVGGVVLLDKLKIDDPVGAFPVHGLCGVWGCMVIGFLPNDHLAAGSTSFAIQAIGTLSFCAWSFLTMGGLFLVLKAIGILRVSANEEQVGLDVSEHGMHAYPGEVVGSPA